MGVDVGVAEGSGVAGRGVLVNSGVGVAGISAMTTGALGGGWLGKLSSCANSKAITTVMTTPAVTRKLALQLLVADLCSIIRWFMRLHCCHA